MKSAITLLAALALFAVTTACSPAAGKNEIPRVTTLPASVKLTKENGETVTLKIDGPKAIADVYAEAYVTSYVRTWNAAVNDWIAKSEPAQAARVKDAQILNVKWKPDATTTPIKPEDASTIRSGTIAAEKAAMRAFYDGVVMKK